MSANVPGEGGDLHSAFSASKALNNVGKEVSVRKLTESFESIRSALDGLLEKAELASKEYSLEELEVSLAFSADGSIGFVSGSAEAGIVLKFTRSKKTKNQDTHEISG